MPLPSSEHLTPHFTAGELRLDRPQANDQIIANGRQVADYLEVVRGILGVPLRVNSGFRPEDYNASVGGSPTSSHVDALAADFVPLGMSQRQAYEKLKAASLPDFDQIIYYPVQGHIHIGLGSRMRREVRIYLAEVASGTKYPFLTSDLVQRLGGTVAGAVAAVVSALPTTPSLGVLIALAAVAVLILSD